MAPKLYADILSPGVRSILLTAKVINIELEYMALDLVKGEHLTPEFKKLNPRHTVPTLDDDGVVVWDSHAIMIYLIEKYASKNSLYPDDVVKRATINRLLFFEAGELFSAHVRICLPIVLGGQKEISQESLGAVEQAIGFLELYLQNSKYAAGEEVTIADFSIWTTLSNIMGYFPLDEKKFPKVLSWVKLMESLPYAEINQKGSKMFREKIKALLGL